MKLKTFQTNNTKHNPFLKHISDEQFKYMLEQGFEKGNLDCYAHLDGDICYRKHLISSIGWVVNIYITENGMAIDHDYDCGGNSNNWTWWFEDGVYVRREYTEMYTKEEDVKYTKIGHSFEDAWNEMVDKSTNL